MPTENLVISYYVKATLQATFDDAMFVEKHILNLKPNSNKQSY